MVYKSRKDVTLGQRIKAKLPLDPSLLREDVLEHPTSTMKKAMNGEKVPKLGYVVAVQADCLLVAQTDTWGGVGLEKVRYPDDWWRDPVGKGWIHLREPHLVTDKRVIVENPTLSEEHLKEWRAQKERRDAFWAGEILEAMVGDEPPESSPETAAGPPSLANDPMSSVATGRAFDLNTANIVTECIDGPGATHSMHLTDCYL